MTKKENPKIFLINEDGREEIRGLLIALDYLAQESKGLGLYFGAHLINVASEGVKMEFREAIRNLKKREEI